MIKKNVFLHFLQVMFMFQNTENSRSGKDIKFSFIYTSPVLQSYQRLLSKQEAGAGYWEKSLQKLAARLKMNQRYLSVADLRSQCGYLARTPAGGWWSGVFLPLCRGSWTRRSGRCGAQWAGANAAESWRTRDAASTAIKRCRLDSVP